MTAVLALTLGQAKAIAVVLAAVLVIGAVVSAWVMKTVVQKLAAVLLLVLLALVVWSQRASLQDCADRVRDDVSLNRTSVDTTCTFLGRDVPITTKRS